MKYAHTNRNRSNKSHIYPQISYITAKLAKPIKIRYIQKYMCNKDTNVCKRVILFQYLNIDI